METMTTEQKILKAADKIFTQKGYAATRTRDIAEEAGTNLALLNYYFGSKERLFKYVVQGKLKMLLGAMGPALSDGQISLEEKISLITQNTRQIAQPVIEKQLKERGIEISATDLIINVLSMTLFPFVAKPLITSSGLVKEEEFVEFVTERKKKIIEWIIKITL